ncbi:DNA adenine methylase [Emcibacter nanhaiensis]|uniref:DNA adenine methylase n=1 Tax=Emcibacter nanhaiensis TaxID=1505037 RepID=A0A501PTF7_9PROT|nr:DNA adenine methylase [Emcibacter nanhaiensis]TPD62991.1 DNA adenine methylase [Emcibacter nanhaiensis]
MAYPGGKNGSGVYQKIINNIPPHRVYIETHLGGGAIMRLKRPADVSYGIDIDKAVCASWRAGHGETVLNGDAVTWLRSYDFCGDEFIYADPPYLMETRRSGPLYNHEYTREQHIELLEALKALPCAVAVSGYYSDLYSELLDGWRHITFEAMTRGGSMATEYLWMNYPEPLELHDYQYLGENFTDRQRIKRKRERWQNKFENLPLMEKQVIMRALQDSRK